MRNISLLKEKRSCDSEHITFKLKGMCSESHDLFTFWEISDNIWEMVQNRDIDAMED